MAEKKNPLEHIDKSRFAFVNQGERISDKKFEDKPIGYFKDALIRFRKSHASVVAFIIIVLIILYSLLAPLLITNHSATFMDNMYAKKPGRVESLREFGILDGGVNRDFSDKSLIRAVAMGMGAEDWDGQGVTLEEGLNSEYQPMLDISDPIVYIGANKKETVAYKGRIDAYLEVGFIYKSIPQSEYDKIVAWEEETGLHVLYPLIEDNEYNMDANDANYWYKSKKGTPVVTNEQGMLETVTYGEGMTLEDNYKRDENGNVVYKEYTGGGTLEHVGYGMVDTVFKLFASHNRDRTCQVDFFLDTVTYHDRFFKHQVVFLKDDGNVRGICRDIDILVDIAETGYQYRSITFRYVKRESAVHIGGIAYRSSLQHYGSTDNRLLAGVKNCS